MFRFEHTYLLYLLAIIPLLWLLFILARNKRKKSIAAFGDDELVKQLMPDVSSSRPRWKFVLTSLGIAALVLGVANPQIGSKYEEVKREGFELIIALDISNSMMAEDLEPNRLERAKQAISKLIDQLKTDKIGIIVFAGQAYVQLPLTTDYGAAKLFLSTVSTDIVPTQGTAVGSAIDLAIKSFGEKQDKNRAVIIITDGENHEDDAIQQATTAVEGGITVHTIGVGSPEGTPIPLYVNGKKSGFRKDNEGNTVITKLDETMLQQVAAAGKGVYIRGNNLSSGMKTLLDEINKMERKEFDSKIFTDYEDRFQYLLAAAILFLLAELLLPERKSRWFGNVSLFEKKTK
jgi:Ca-activated chloride channel family protein